MASRTSVAILVLLVAIIVFLVLTCALGWYVYRDAKKRGLNALMWTLICLFVPGFIGLIIYLVARSQYTALRCPQCARNVSIESRHCPWCGELLHSVCPQCGTSLRPDWQRCAQCGTNLGVVRPARAAPSLPEESRGWRWFIVALVVAPLLLMCLAVGGLVMFQSPASFQSWSSTWNPDFEADLTTSSPSAKLSDRRREEILDWLTECKRLQQPVSVYQFKDYLSIENQHRYTIAIYLQDEDSTKNMIAVGHFDYQSEKNLVIADFTFKEQTAESSNAKEDAFYGNGREPSASRLLWFSTEREQDYERPLELRFTINGETINFAK